MNKFLDALHLFLFSLTCLIPLVAHSTARPTIVPTSGFFPTPKTPQLQGVWNPRSPTRNTRMLSPRVEANVFEKRTPPGFTSPAVVKMKMITYQTVGMITPIASAAKALEDFYSSIAVKAAGAWEAEPTTDNFAIEEGGFRLAFTSMGDTIPWSFVKTFADRLWESACLGLTSLFDVMYMDDAGQVAVSISLRLIEGSSSDSTEYREGSVPSVTSP